MACGGSRLSSLPFRAGRQAGKPATTEILIAGLSLEPGVERIAQAVAQQVEADGHQ
jgi:hypothetical protein